VIQAGGQRRTLDDLFPEEQEATMQPSAYTDDVIRDLGALISGTRPEQMSDQTPCAKWTVHDLINHVVGGGHMFAAAFRGESLPGMDDASGAMPDLLGDEPAGAFDETIADYRDAIARPGVADRMVTLPFGTMPGQVAMDIAAVDLLIHCWDLARATGQTFRPSPEFVDAAEAFAHVSIPPEARDGDAFAAQVPAPRGASALERLIAFTGRQP
jgi:uncharacterized protein (TIGR03086 family)